MMRRERGRLSLTNRLLTLAALIVVMTTLLLTITFAAGVYEMALRQEAARQVAYRDLVLADVTGRLNGAYRVTRTAAEESSLASEDVQVARRALANSVVENAQYLEGMALLSSDGDVVGAWPSSVLDAVGTADLVSLSAAATVAPVLWERSSDTTGGGFLWMAAPVATNGPGSRTLISRVRTDFVDQILKEVGLASGAPVAVVVDTTGRPLFAGENAEVLNGAVFEFTPDEDGAGRGAVRLNGQRDYVGYYADVLVPPGLGWRVAALEPAEYAAQETRDALRPGIVGWMAALVLALAASLAVVSRTTQPLRLLERRARALASGVELEAEAVAQHDEIGRVLDAFNSVAARLRRLSDIAELLASASDRELVLSGVTGSIAHMLGDVDVDVLLLAEDGSLTLVAAEGELAGREGLRLDAATASSGWIGQVLSGGESSTAVVGEDEALATLHGAEAPGAGLAVPLRTGAETIGIVIVVRHGAAGFAELEVETVRSFGAQASVALRNSRLFDEERRSRREAEAVRRIAERAASPIDVQETLSDIGRLEADLLGFGDPLVVIRDRGAYGLPIDEAYERDRAWFAAWEESSGGSVRHDAATGPFVVDASAGRPALLALVRESGGESALVTVLAREDDVAGLLVLIAGPARLVLSERQFALADTVGKQASLALQNAYLFEQAKSRADNLETIFRISHAVGSSLQSRVVLNRVLDVVQKILSADAVMLMTYDSQRKVMSVPMARGILHRDMLETVIRPGEDVPGRVFETREPERFDRISEADTRLLNAAAAQGLESLLVVPLLARGRSIGVLAVFARGQAAFSTDDLDLLRTFASQAALAIDTAEMFSREHHVATVLQESILPARLPRIPGVDASSVYLPAGSEGEIGGDYYDLFTDPQGRVVLAIGDVCGKGVAAATKTSMLKYVIRGMVAAGSSPAVVLEEINRMLLESGDPSSIVTLWVGRIDQVDGTLVFANGGHPPGLLLHPATGRIDRLATTGALLGAVAGAAWSERSVRMERGAMLLLYTDGVTEARNGSHFFGEGRVRRALRQGGAAALVTQRVLALVQRFAAGDLRDDAAIVTLTLIDPTDGATGVTAEELGGK